MQIRSLAIASLALLAASAALAGESAPKVAQPPAAPRQTLVAEVTAGMRELLRAVTPEISLPALEVKLPTLDAQRR
ncbi:MAG TPA: hypothetical protein VM692_11670 [Gammaproteobacteria bacterium]|nr:hypothetical protein [Gammaproteobacteria bacterium]